MQEEKLLWVKKFSARLREASAFLKQGEFANKIGATQALVSMYKRGKRLPSLDALRVICLSLGVSSDWLLGLTDEARSGGVSVTAGDGSAIAAESPGAYVHAGALPSHDSDQSQVPRLLAIIESQQRVIENLSGSKK